MEARAPRRPGGRPTGQVRRRRRRRDLRRSGGVLVRGLVEAAAIGVALLVAVVAGLGRLSERFAGSGLWTNLLPFAAGVLVLGLLAALALWAWFFLRSTLTRLVAGLPLVLAIAVAFVALRFARDPTFQMAVANLRLLVGGSEEAERVTLAHQVFAAYRRADLRELERVLEREQGFDSVVHEAAAAFCIDPELLAGVGIVESSFLPRDSTDGGRGVFQITAVPTDVEASVRGQLGVSHLDPHDNRQNAFLAASTLRRYLDQMQGDLFLGLLAYNIGPRNGGLLSIMQQYGARDFITIQPYLQQLPRDYPIRVLTAALAYRLWRSEGHLPHYEQGDNARHIQEIGIPGLT